MQTCYAEVLKQHKKAEEAIVKQWSPSCFAGVGRECRTHAHGNAIRDDAPTSIENQFHTYRSLDSYCQANVMHCCHRLLATKIRFPPWPNSVNTPIACQDAQPRFRCDTFQWTKSWGLGFFSASWTAKGPKMGSPNLPPRALEYLAWEILRQWAKPFYQSTICTWTLPTIVAQAGHRLQQFSFLGWKGWNVLKTEAWNWNGCRSED